MENTIIDIINQFGYIAVMLLIAIENIFPPIPSEIILTFGGFVTTTSNLNILLVIIFATIGSILGAILLYGVGRLFSKERLEKWVNGKVGKILRLKAKNIELANDWFIKKGYITVFICRFIPIVRSLISIPAGMTKMNFGIFIILTTLGSLIWNSVLIILGSVAGESWPNIIGFIDIYRNIIIIVFLVLLVIAIIYFIKKKKTK